MKPLVIYHANCMDGAAAALAAYFKFGDDAEYRPASYGDPAPTDEEVCGRDVYVLDFSYPRAELERLVAVCGNDSEHSRGYDEFIVLDHHKSAAAELGDLPFCEFHMDMCGARMSWRYFNKPEAPTPELFQYIEDCDLWRWELPHSREINAALAASGALTDFRKLIDIYSLWASNNNPGEPFGKSILISDGSAILRAERLMVERIVASAEEVEIEYTIKHGDRVCDVVTGERVRALATSAVLRSEVGEALALESARRGRDAVGVVYYRDGAAGKWRVSLRSRDTRVGADGAFDSSGPAPDVSAVAKSFGGGGHHQAAGFECDELPWMKR